MPSVLVKHQTPSGPSWYMVPSSWDIPQEGDCWQQYFYPSSSSRILELHLVPDVEVKWACDLVRGGYFFFQPRAQPSPSPQMTHPSRADVSTKFALSPWCSHSFSQLSGLIPSPALSGKWFSLRCSVLVWTTFIRQGMTDGKRRVWPPSQPLSLLVLLLTFHAGI